MTPQAESDKERRRRQRALIRAHHPDRGGDPAEFISCSNVWTKTRSSAARIQR